eukprot:13167220-Alexandrium_andersonii.AAC.1
MLTTGHMRDRLLRDVGFLDNFAAVCQVTRNVVKAVRALGFHHHPVARRVLAGPRQQAHHRGRKILVQVLYHTDPETLWVKCA